MRGIKRLIGSAMLGVLALAVLYFTAPYTGVYIPVSRLAWRYPLCLACRA